MSLVVTDPKISEQLIAERQRNGWDRWDEVWEGVYFMAPAPNLEHQKLVGDFVIAITAILDDGRLGTAYPGINVSDRQHGWERNYRCPDVAVYLAGNPSKSCDTHWCGGPDLAIEIVSAYDRSREKLPFYAAVKTRELLIVDRDPWRLELYRLKDRELEFIGESTVENSQGLSSEVLSAKFQLVAGSSRPVLRVEGAGRAWNL